ncbi:MAG TPA: sugar transferase [Candidatus Eisenbacteria bacterium]|nr:sugar transferase [Candidatus Eisenbacteria bacterium]
MIFPSELVSKPRRAENEPGPLYSSLKRTIDIIGSGVGLFILMPVFVILAIAIKIDSPGPVFYVQERIGKNRRRARRDDPSQGPCRRRQDTFGRPFKIYKLRSMVVNAEKNTGPVWAAASDSRITRMGGFLRKTRLDETPQLWNVLRGDMSLVGPRPERPSFVVTLAQSLPEYPVRCSTLPGITGLAQVKSQYDSSIETVNRKLQYDLYYVRHGRFMLDLKIMAATVKVMARGEGAH